MSAKTADETDLEACIEALRHELAGIVVALCAASRRLDDITGELRSRRHASKVVALDHRRRGERGRASDILGGFLEER